MAGPPADKEEDPDDSSSAAQGSAAAPRGGDARVVGSGDGDRRMLVRPGRSPGRAPARTRVPDPGAAGTLVTGQVGLGQVVFVPATVRVGALHVSPGRAAYPGQEPY